MGGRLVITDRTDRMVTAAWGPLFLPLFLDGATLESLEVMDREEGAIIRRHPAGVTVLALVPELPTKAVASGVRDKSTEMFGRYAPHLLGAGTVVGGSGFFASLIRSMVAGAALLSRSRVPQKTFARVDDAVRWASELPRQHPSIAREREAIVEAIQGLAIEHGVDLG